MSYSVRYSERQHAWYISVDGNSDDFGTALYEYESQANDELADMVTEGLISKDEIR